MSVIDPVWPLRDVNSQECVKVALGSFVAGGLFPSPFLLFGPLLAAG